MDDHPDAARLAKAEAELDRLLNDPDAAFDPRRVWSLLAELTARDASPHCPDVMSPSAPRSGIPGSLPAP